MRKSSSKNFRVLAYDRKHPQDQSMAWLQSKGLEVVVGPAQTDPNFKRYSDDAIIEWARDVDAVLGLSSANFNRNVLEALPRLKYISKVGVGYDNIDIEAATQRGIQVTNTLESAGTGAVAEHAVTLILGLMKRLTIWHTDFLAQGGWRDVNEFSYGLEGSTLGLVGFGRIGQAVAQRLSGWNVQFLIHDPFCKNEQELSLRFNVKFVSFGELIAQSDVVSLHCDLTANNKHLINANVLRQMKPTAMLINTARGGLVDTQALTHALSHQIISGAALDVFEEEPPNANDRLFQLPNLLVTPHVSARTLAIFLNRHQRAAENLWAMICGEGHADRVNHI